MTTHLVIADDETLGRITSANGKHSPLARRVHPTDDLDAQGSGDYTHLVTCDTWLFRTPDDDTLALTCDFVYPASVMGAIAGSRALRHHRAGDRQRRILPLIAACDLLGIEEL